MKYFLYLCFFNLWVLGFCRIATKRGVITSIAEGASTVVSSLVHKVDDTVKEIPVVQNILPSYCVEPPDQCPNENITFWYYSRSEPDTPLQLNISNPESFKNLNKNQNPWKVIIHGYTKSKDEIPNPQLRSAYFHHGNYNLISVDYEPLARDKCYIQAVKSVPLIAKCIAQMIDALIERNFFNSTNLHVIGYSLGAQIAGHIYEYMENEKPSRVTGLDPAAPLFDGVVNEKLSQKAGKFVDVIHTNALIKGKLAPSGHVDFYVNGGISQPGCSLDSIGTFSTCSHNRSPLYFAESINSEEGFWGIPCSGYLEFYGGLCFADNSELVQMGEFIPHTARGIYYLQTSDKEPFALGKMATVHKSN